MFKIKRQINLLYASSIIGSISITGAWVAILASRGFTLVQIGLAETIFHITSLIFEVPSGVIADLFGRKKSLIISNVLFILGNLLMAFGNGFAGVCVSFVFHALGYNFASGSGDALAYDSFKYVGEEALYERYNSNQVIIYRITSGISTLCAGVALALGYKSAYLISVFSNLLSLIFIMGLAEVRLDEGGISKKEITSTIIATLSNHIKECVEFFRNNKKAGIVMFSNSLVGALDILLLFFLQSKIMDRCESRLWLGAILFFMELGGILGAKLILYVKPGHYKKLFLICTVGVLFGILLEHSGIAIIMGLGGFIAAVSDDAIQIRTNTLLQDNFPSSQRATLASLMEFTFSVIMIILSPLAGLFFMIW